MTGRLTVVQVRNLIALAAEAVNTATATGHAIGGEDSAWSEAFAASNQAYDALLSAIVALTDAQVDQLRGYCTGCVGEPGGPDDHDPAECSYGVADQDDAGHSTPLAAAGLASGVLGVAGLVATHGGSPGLGLVLAAVGGITGVVVLVLGRRGRDGGAS